MHITAAKPNLQLQMTKDPWLKEPKVWGLDSTGSIVPPPSNKSELFAKAWWEKKKDCH